MPRPVFTTRSARRSPSVGRMQMQRTRPSPICWATSARIFDLRPSTSISSSTAWLISGRLPGGNSTSTTGPAMATTRPSARSVIGSATVLTFFALLLGFGLLPGRRWSRRLPLVFLAERLGAADDLHDLGGDGVLAGAVHHPAKRLDQLLGVVGRRLHRPLAGGVLGGGRLEHRREHLGLQPAGKQAGQYLRRLRFELVQVVRGLRLVAARHRHQLPRLHRLATQRDEPGVDELYLVDLTLLETGDHGAGDLARVLVARAVRDAGQGIDDRLAPEPEEALALAPHGHQLDVAARVAVLAHETLHGSDDRHVVAPGQAAVARYHHDDHPPGVGDV